MYVENSYRVHKFDDEHVLLTTEHGSWVVLNKQEFNLLRMNKLEENSKLMNILEEKGIVVTEKNTERIAEMYKERFHHLFNGISLHVIVPTLRCNHKCIYCQASSVPMASKGYDMDRDTAKAVVDFIFQTPSKFLTIEFQGGEPLANFSIIEFMVEYAKKKNGSNKSTKDGWFYGKKSLNFRIVSNLSLMDLDILDFILKNNIMLNSSLDGPKELHNKNRAFSGAGSYEKVVYWIDTIKKDQKYRLFTALLPTITRYSFKYWKEIVDEYISHDFYSLFMRPLNISGNTIKNFEKIGYTSEEFVAFWKEYMQYVFSLNKKGISFFDEASAQFLGRMTTLKPPLNACLNIPCGACLIQAAYNQWGDVYTCDEGRANEVFKIGNVKENGYRQIFTSDQALNFIAMSSMTSSILNISPWYPFVSPCLVSSYGYQNNLILKLSSDFLLKIREAQVEYLFRNLIFSEENKETLMKWASVNIK
jgi:His-Xaa-Ser system radical SAM maturase HxsB